MQADDGALVWLESYAEVGASLVVYRVSVGVMTDHQRARHGNVSVVRTATYHDAVLALYQCARTRWLATSGDSCQCMTDRNDFRSTLARVSVNRRRRLLLQMSLRRHQLCADGHVWLYISELGPDFQNFLTLNSN